MSSSDDMMLMFIPSICFTILKKFLSNSPSINPSSNKMDVVITVMMLFVLMIGCMGVDHGKTNLTAEYKRKVFDIFNKTSSNKGEHAKWMKYHWNLENPLQKVSDHRKLYRHAWPVIEEKCREYERQAGVNREHAREILSQIHREIAEKYPEDRRLMHKKLLNDHPEFRNFSRDLTWSLVHDWHRYYAKDIVRKGPAEWTGEMKATLSYIRDQVKKDGEETKDEISRRWNQLYPQYRVTASILEYNLRDFDLKGYLPTENDLKKAKERYDNLFIPKEKRGRGRKWRWTNQMLTDLIYIASNLDARDKHFSQKLKKQWDQMNVYHDSASENVLLKRLYKMKNDTNFELLEKYVQRAKMRYDELTPIDESSFENFGVRQPEKLIKFLRVYKELFSKLIRNMNYHDMSGHSTDIPPSSPQYSHSEHSSEASKEASPPHKYHHPEFQQNLSTSIHSPTFFSDFGYFPDYAMQHHPNMSGYDVQASTSTPRLPASSYSPRGGTSSPHNYYRPELPQDFSAPIHAPPFFSEFGYPDDSMHRHSRVSRFDEGASSSTSHLSHSGHPSEGRISPPYEYHYPEFTRDLSYPIHSPLRISDFGYPPEYNMQNLPYDLIFDPHSNHTSCHTGEGNSTQNQSQKPPKS